MQQVSAEMSSLLGCYAERSDILCKDTPIHDEFKIIEIILFSKWGHYKIFCVNVKYRIQNRVLYFLFYIFTPKE